MTVYTNMFCFELLTHKPNINPTFVNPKCAWNSSSLRNSYFYFNFNQFWWQRKLSGKIVSILRDSRRPRLASWEFASTGQKISMLWYSTGPRARAATGSRSRFWARVITARSWAGTRSRTTTENKKHIFLDLLLSTYRSSRDRDRLRERERDRERRLRSRDRLRYRLRERDRDLRRSPRLPSGGRSWRA